MSLNTNNNRRVWSNEAGYLHWLFGISFSPIDDEWEDKWEGIKTEYDKCYCGRFVEEKDELCKECFQNFLQKFKKNINGKKWNKEEEECFGCGDFGNCLNQGIPNKLYLCEDCFDCNMNCVPTECGCLIIRDSRDHDECRCDDDGNNWICADCYDGEYDYNCNRCLIGIEKGDICADCMDYGELLNKQPFYIVSDDAYDRMKTSLLNGEKFVKTYTTICPHQTKTDCNCPYNINFLKDDKIVRISNKQLKIVYPLSQLSKL